MISVDAPRSFTNGKGAVPPCPFRGADRERGFSSTVVSAALAVRLRGYAGQMGCWVVHPDIDSRRLAICLQSTAMPVNSRAGGPTHFFVVAHCFGSGVDEQES